ncbi:Nif3-like dinuclear metal center hexameric protein [Legionella sp. MW5194]|uniref:Nif3-like dinuclear metal center hexameric protein n=1 Tax=Legionella sp. MW5194 TaxID=2662448 RepID=UPI00193D8024|nr:Nif3-like dinuclear metal center hexameric protein [Legionella sp. MW5194]QRN04223.1 Nif3-like dinuclear metal center hexameric protein [Legionella sp. MW5194]
MITRQVLVDYLHTLLAVSDFNDYAPNGLQVEGQASIRRICTAVTASEAVIRQAAAVKADALLVHHGYFWRGEPPTITGMKGRRISELLHHQINLLAYHLPLDCHPELGNNAQLAKRLSVDEVTAHKAGGIDHLLWSGTLNKSLSVSELAKQLGDALGRDPLVIASGDKAIQRLAWCSGGAQDYIEDAYRLGVDAYFSGEVSERTYYQAKELGIHYFACGHHATERYGIQALGAHLADTFDVQHQFIDSDNPV